MCVGRAKFVFALLLLAGCGGKEAVAPEDQEAQAFEDYRASIAEVIEDPDRQADVLTVIDSLREDFKRMRQAVELRRTTLRRLNADYDATREQFQEFIAKYDAEIMAARAGVTARRMELVHSMTPEEWDALTKADSKAMSKMVSMIQAI
jgi:TolA-binding protein